MFASLYMAFSNIMKRRLQSALITLTLFASFMLLATALAILINTRDVYDKASDELNSSQVYIYSIAKYEPYKEAENYWSSREDVSAQFYKYIQYSDIITMESQEIDLGVCIIPMSECSKTQDQIKIVEGEDKVRPDIGEIWIPTGMAYNNNIRLNDSLTFKMNGETKKLTVSGIFVDPPFAAPLGGVTEVFVSPEDIDFFGNIDDSDYLIKLRFSDESLIESTLMEWEESLDHPFMGIVYMKEQFRNLGSLLTNIASIIMLITSLILSTILILVIIYSISSDIFGDYKSIGVLMALGFSKRATRRVYLFQYFIIYLISIAIALIASTFLTNIILNKLFLKSLGFNGVQMNLALPFALVIFISFIIVFISVYLVARSASHINPVEAIQIGNAKAKIKSREKESSIINSLSSVSMLIIKNLSVKKRQGIFLGIVAALITSITLIIISAKRPLEEQAIFRQYSGIGQENVNITCDTDDKAAIEKLVEDLNHDDQVSEVFYISSTNECSIMKQDGVGKSAVLTNILGKGVNDDNYAVAEGKNPKEDNEIAISTVLANRYKKTINETIKFYILGQEIEAQITGIFNSTEELGYCVRVSDKLILSINPDFIHDTYRIVLKDGADESAFMAKYEEKEGVKKVLSVNEHINEISETVFSGVNIAIVVVNVVLWGILLVILVNVITLAIIQERKDLGILKTIGFKAMSTKLTLIGPVFCCSFFGTIIGAIAINVFGGQLMSKIYAAVGVTDCPFLITPKDIIALAFIYLFFIVLSSYLPMKKILKISPRELIVE